ncbi:hypothetical protein BSKO_05243 [Bryopsis sp. KO-2023]|nr:hypothetical protein BSKO_05243 [Bryopsis sp. KO-2023]
MRSEERITLYCILAGVLTSALMCGLVHQMTDTIPKEKSDGNGNGYGNDGYYYGNYYGRIAHSFDKIVYETCKAPVIPTSTADPEPELSFRQKWPTYLVDVVIYIIVRFLFRSFFAFVTASPTIIAITITAVDKSTATIIRICLQIRRLAGL